MARPGRESLRRACRIGWIVLTVATVETLVCGVSVQPVVLGWLALFGWRASHAIAGPIVLALAVLPSYAVFALLLMPTSTIAGRLLRWKTPEHAFMPIAEMGWPLLRWARSLALQHVVRVVAGPWFRGTPLWTAYLRMAGARLGRRVYVNSLSVSDYNMLAFGDDVVIGADVHLSGHTVEGGVVKTGAVRLGRHVTVGLGSTIGIDVEVADGCEIGALSLLPKHTRLDARGVYVGVPAHRIA